MITCNVIATGSTGNATILNDYILIDCGVPYKKIEPYVADLKLVLLTHIHRDHFAPKTIGRLAKERPILRFCCAPWMVTPLLNAGVQRTRIDVTGEYTLIYGGNLRINSFPLIHDVENCGWKIELDGEKAIYATDTASMNGISAEDYDLYMIEANYLEAELEERIATKLDSGEFCYETRAKESHLSKEKADAWLAENAGPHSKITYMHKHIEKKKQEES